MLVTVKNGNIKQAYTLLTKLLNKDGIFRLLREREYYQSPSKKRLKKHKIAVGRIKKIERKKIQAFDNQESRLIFRTTYRQNQK